MLQLGTSKPIFIDIRYQELQRDCTLASAAAGTKRWECDPSEEPFLRLAAGKI